MECSHIRRKLSEYVDDELEATESLAVSEHLRNCDMCERDYKELSLLLTALTDVPYAEPPQHLRAKIIAATCGIPEPATWLERARLGLFGNHGLSWGAAAALVVLGVLIIHREPPSHPKVTRAERHPAVATRLADIPTKVSAKVPSAPSPVVEDHGTVAIHLRHSEPATVVYEGHRDYIHPATPARSEDWQEPKPVVVASAAVRRGAYVAKPEMQPVEPAPEVVEKENPPIEPIESTPVESVPEPQPPAVEPRVANNAVRDAIRREDIDNYIRTLNRGASRVRYDQNKITYKVVSKKF